MFRIFDFICFFSFMFLFGEILFYFCKDAFIICNESLKSSVKNSHSNTKFDDQKNLRKII